MSALCRRLGLLLVAMPLALACDDRNGAAIVDRPSASPEPGPIATDQSDSPASLEITRRIREAVVADDSLSTRAHNVMIVTRAGVVTLRGDVTQTERDAIDRHARGVAGVTSVDDQLHVTN